MANQESPERYYYQQWIENPSITLFNSPYYPFIMSFLTQIFEERQRKSIPEEEMNARLQDYLNRMQEQQEKGSLPADFHVPPGPAGDLLKMWCDQRHRWLFHEVRSSETYSLTPVTHQVFDFTENSIDQNFSAYKTRNLLGDIVHRTRELASGLKADRESHIHYHEDEINRLKSEIQEHEDAILKFSQMEDDVNASVYSPSEKDEIRQYILNLLQQLRLEISRYITMTEETANEFFAAAIEISKTAASEDAIQIYLDHVKEIQENPDFQSIYELRGIIGNPKLKEQLRKDNETINYDATGKRNTYSNSIAAQIDDAYLETTKVNGHLRHVHQMIEEILRRENLQEQRHIERCLYRLDFAGKALHDAMNPRAKPVSIHNGLPFEFSTLAFMGRPLSLSKQDRVQHPLTEIEMGKNMAAPETRKSRPKLNRARLKQNLLAYQKAHDVVTLGRVTRAYPIQQGLIEFKAYLELMNDSGADTLPQNLEFIRIDDEVKHTQYGLVGHTIMMKPKKESNYDE